MAFSFGFQGEDIDTTEPSEPSQQPLPPLAPAPTYGAFPIAGKPQLPPSQHSLETLIARLPSKIAYSYLDVQFDEGRTDGQPTPPMRIPRRELWDVRVQLMAEDDLRNNGALEGLGEHDVKTGVYEGGFKSWESSVDLVKTLAATKDSWAGDEHEFSRIIELGCGTALPSLALFQWAIDGHCENKLPRKYHFVVADYNPTVLQLVTLPNFILSWAALQRLRHPVLEQAFIGDEELELTPEVLQVFQTFLLDKSISFAFLSGAWSPEQVDMIYSEKPESNVSVSTLLLGAETIYSPFALAAFTEMTFSILEREQQRETKARAFAYIAAKRLYFGVGGSLDDFIDGVRSRGGVIETLREETDGVRRGVVRCSLS